MHLKRAAGNAYLLYEELYILLVQVTLNSLSPLSADANDYSPLTTVHFFIRRSYITMPNPILQHIKKERLSNWQQV